MRASFPLKQLEALPRPSRRRVTAAEQVAETALTVADSQQSQIVHHWQRIVEFWIIKNIHKTVATYWDQLGIRLRMFSGIGLYHDRLQKQWILLSRTLNVSRHLSNRSWPGPWPLQ